MRPAALRFSPLGVVGFCLAAALAAACGPSEITVTPATVDGDRLLYEAGEAALTEQDWVRAREYFLQVRDNYPQSPLRADARLGVADSYEGQGGAESYVSALAEYQDFLRLYPTHPRADYAQYKLGLVHQHQMRAPERDQSWTRSAIREFETFIERYPNSPLIPEVQQSLREAQDRLSQSEYIVGRYYHRRRWWPGAIDRLRALSETDPNFAARGDLYFYLADSLYRARQWEEALSLFQRFADQHPESELIEDVNEAVVEIEAALAARPADNAESGQPSETVALAEADTDATTDADPDHDAPDHADGDQDADSPDGIQASPPVPGPR